MTSGFAADAASIDGVALRAAYERDGFFALTGVFKPVEIGALCDEAEAICNGERGDVRGADVLREHGDPDVPMLAKVLAIHFPHKASELMLQTLFQPAIVRALNCVIGPDVKCMQSMLFAKSAGKPGQAWHQDEFYIPTRDRSLIGIWIALDDAVVENGGLWVHPGSNRHGVIWPTRAHGDERFDRAQEAFDFPYEHEGGVPIEVKAGDVVFFHGYLLHRSLPNRRERGFRRALVNHCMSAQSLLPWSFGGKPRTDYRDIVLVSGEDPYAWKGLEDLSSPFIRPEDAEQARLVFQQVGSKRE